MSGKNVTPDFFIIGAPRCGTTALSTYLSEHPDICFSIPKEPLYFLTDMPSMRDVSSEEEYLGRCFGHCRDKEYSAVGEGSVWYLYSSNAIDNILSKYPYGKFIVMVRNPLDMVPSFHQKANALFLEDVADFHTAWNLQERRKRGLDIPVKCREPRLLDYARIGRLGAQLHRVYQQIPESQRLVIVFDDFVRDIVGTYKSVLEFLDVPYDGRLDFRRINENKQIRNRFLYERAWYPPGSLMALVNFGKRLFHIKKLSILPRLRKKLVVPTRRPPLTAEIRQLMINEFAEDIDLLASLLNRDLSDWKQS